jgi:hypothetical protein
MVDKIESVSNEKGSGKFGAKHKIWVQQAAEAKL